MAIESTPTLTGVSHAPARTFSWTREFTVWLGMVLVVATSHLVVGWYNGRGLRPLMTAGVVLYLSSAMAVGARRRWKAAHRGEIASRWRFSMAELIWIVTGVVAYLGFSAADYHDSLRGRQEQQRSSALAEAILGPEGRFDFDSQGRISIAICDRSFDDKRLAALARLIRERNLNSKVQSLMFGSGPKTAGAPRWPDVTDQSVEGILHWSQLEWLFIQGTGITPAGREKLTRLPALHEFSRSELVK